MGNLNELANRIAEAPTALNIISKRFFAQSDVQDAIIEKVQEQSIGGMFCDGTEKNEYAEYTLTKREEFDYKPWSFIYTGHESGALFRSMDIIVEDEGFKVVSEDGWGKGLDILNESRFGDGEPDHIRWYFMLYDEEGKTLGLTSQKLLSLLEELQFKDFVQAEFKTALGL